jgi:hypothetical protein
MSDSEAPAYQRLLAAADAINEIGRAARGQLPAALEHALESVLAAIDLPEGGIYLYSSQLHNLALAAAVPSNGLLANQGTQLWLANDQTSLPILAAATCMPQMARIGDWELGIAHQPPNKTPKPSYKAPTLSAKS